MNYIGRKDNGRYISTTGTNNVLSRSRTYVFSDRSGADKFAESYSNAEVLEKHGCWSVQAKQE